MKTISISEGNWEYLQNLRVKYNFRSMEDLISLILVHTKEAIKQKDLKIIRR